jgi:ABC-2 type transport system permease protein
MSLFLFQMANELRKLFARKRTYIGFGAFLLVEGFVLFMINLPKPRAHFRRLIEQNGYGFDQYFSGLTLGLLMLMWTTFLLGALYLALVSGDLVSKEVEDGTLRMTLCRPVSRSRIIALKYISSVIYTFVLIFFIGATAMAAGVLYHGLGGLFVFAPTEKIFALHEQWPGMARYFCALPLLALSLATVSSLGFMLSCFNMKPAAATIVTLSVMFLDSIFRNIPYFESLQPWFITTHMSAWLQAFAPYVPVWSMVEDYAYLFALDATFLVIALAVFQTRDFKA